MILGDVDRSFHASSCRHHTSRDREWINCYGWDVRFAQVASHDRTVSFHHGPDQCDRVSFSYSRPHASFGCRYLGLRDPGGRAVCFIQRAPTVVGAWRWIFVLTAVASLYLNVFVLVVQSFVKVSALNALAPTQTEPPFAITQVVVLAIFILIALIAVIKFRPSTTVQV
jgi:hypothetical protein